MHWAEKVDILLSESGESRASLARRAGVNQTTLNQAIRKRAGINAGDGIRIAEALGVAAEWLFNDDLGRDEMRFKSHPPTEAERKRREIRAAAEFLDDDSEELDFLHEQAVGLLGDATDRRGSEISASQGSSPSPRRTQDKAG